LLRTAADSSAPSVCVATHSGRYCHKLDKIIKRINRYHYSKAKTTATAVALKVKSGVGETRTRPIRQTKSHFVEVRTGVREIRPAFVVVVLVWMILNYSKWRWGESNPRPKKPSTNPLRACSFICSRRRHRRKTKAGTRPASLVISLLRRRASRRVSEEVNSQDGRCHDQVHGCEYRRFHLSHPLFPSVSQVSFRILKVPPNMRSRDICVTSPFLHCLRSYCPSGLLRCGEYYPYGSLVSSMNCGST